MLKFIVDLATDTNVLERITEIPMRGKEGRMGRKIVALVDESTPNKEPINIGWHEPDGSYTAQPGYRFFIEEEGEPTVIAPTHDERVAMEGAEETND
jgi:hypothetical protein